MKDRNRQSKADMWMKWGARMNNIWNGATELWTVNWYIRHKSNSGRKKSLPLFLLVLRIICNIDLTRYHLWQVLGCNCVWYSVKRFFDKHNRGECNCCIMLNVVVFQFYNILFSLIKARITKHISKFTLKIITVIWSMSRKNGKHRITRRKSTACHNRRGVIRIHWCTADTKNFAHITVVQQITHFIVGAVPVYWASF